MNFPHRRRERRQPRRGRLLLTAGALVAPLLAVTAATGAPGVAPADDRCAALTGAVALPDMGVQITRAELVEGYDGGWEHILPKTGRVPDHCLVDGTFATGTTFVVKLPLDGSWNSDFFMQGCGGNCGREILPRYEPIIDQLLSQGFAVGWTDLHEGAAPGEPYDTWSRDNHDAVLDYYSRATHNTTVAGKQLVGAFYERELRHSYFHGNSTGGRNAMIGLQRYPHDYDGIVAGAPALNSALSYIWNGVANIDAAGRNVMSASKLPVLHQAVLDRCDGADGLKDEVIEDPRVCDFKPAQIQCRSDQDPGTCLTAAEVAVVEKLYATPYNSLGKPVMGGGHRLEPGSELYWAGWLSADDEVGKPAREYPNPTFMAATNLLRYSEHYFFEEAAGPDYWADEFDFDLDVDRLVTFRVLSDSREVDLRRFRDAGGKVIMYNGWPDQSVTPRPLVDYYEGLTRFMGGAEETQSFARLFMIPGKDHSSFDPGGSGAHTIDWVGAITGWVRSDQAPDALVGTNEERGFSRTLYPYPLVSRWNRQGDVNAAKNWVAVDPGATPQPTVRKPGKARKLRVSGAPHARQRLVRWVRPASTGPAAPTSYRVVVRARGRVVVRRDVGAAGARRVVLRRGQLASSGRYVVTVRAGNGAGFGPTATTRFTVRR